MIRFGRPYLISEFNESDFSARKDATARKNAMQEKTHFSKMPEKSRIFLPIIARYSDSFLLHRFNEEVTHKLRLRILIWAKIVEHRLRNLTGRLW